MVNVVEPGMSVWVRANAITALEKRGKGRSDFIRGTVLYAGRRFASVEIPLDFGVIQESFSYNELFSQKEAGIKAPEEPEEGWKIKRPGKRGAAVEG